MGQFFTAVQQKNKFLGKLIITERVMGFEPTTASLARKYSTTELHPRSQIRFSTNYNCQVVEFIKIFKI